MTIKGLFPRLVPVPKTKLMEQKAAILPNIAAFREFFSPDGGATMIDINDMSAIEFQTTMAFVAYWYVATRWRAQKIAEAPLMVVQEDQKTGEDEWIPNHELTPVLETPTQDFDMGELLERTSRYLDEGSECVWTIDRDAFGIPVRLVPFRHGMFTVYPDDTRLYARFTVNTRTGQQDFDASDVCYFRDAQEDWGIKRSRLSIAMHWLRLGEKARKTISDLLSNAVWPSAVVIPDKDWSPDPETFEQYKHDLEAYSLPGNKGKPFVQLGGGSFNSLAAKIRDLVPGEVLDRVESVVSAVSGVPAIVLQFQIGLVNSPWSQMAQARRMAYDDTIQPAWNKIERVLTRQLLRPVDEDTSHYIRFDKSKVESLKADRLIQAQTMTLIGKVASVNERRQMVDLEPSKDPKADEIPELTQPTIQDILAAGGGPGGNAKPGQPGAEPAKPADPNVQPAKMVRFVPSATLVKYLGVRPMEFYQRKFRASSLRQMLRDEAHMAWKVMAQHQLDADKKGVQEIIHAYLTDGKSLQWKARSKDRVMTAVIGYLKDESRPRWAKATTPMLVRAAERSTAIVAADIGINYNLLHPSTVAFAHDEIGEFITGISNTTRKAINDAIASGLEAGLSVKDIADAVGQIGAFSDSRAELIARTELTRAFNGGPNESLKAFGKATGRQFIKTWAGVLDDVERDEHVVLEGETVGIDDTFSNGLDYPSEPNCRCVALNSEVE